MSTCDPDAFRRSVKSGRHRINQIFPIQFGPSGVQPYGGPMDSGARVAVEPGLPLKRTASELKTFLAWSSVFGSSDEALMSRVKVHDDSQAFGELVLRWRRPIQDLCSRMTGDLHRSEDLVQEIFARLYSRRMTYEPRAKFSTLLWRMAVNRCHDELRQTRRRRECALDDLDAVALRSEDFSERGSAPDELALECERAEAVRSALLQIDEPHRVVVILRHYEGLRFREIAEVLRIPEGTVKSRMADALARLHRMLNPLFADPQAQPEQTSESILI